MSDKANHTAGPFHVETRQHVHAICCRPSRPNEHSEVAFIPIAATSFPGAPKGDLSAGEVTAQQRTREELAANAALFAAAPDLLEACRSALAYIAADVEIEEYEQREGMALALNDQLAAAIAKARGARP